MIYQQIVGIPIGTNCDPLIADLFLYCYERDFMSDLQKLKRFDLIDMFNDTSRYLDDIFTIDNPEFEKHISDINPAELQLNKANTSDKETSFLDLNIKVIGSDVYDKRDGDYMTGLVQTSSETTWSWSLSPLIVSRDSFGHHTWARFQPGGAQPALFGCR